MRTAEASMAARGQTGIWLMLSAFRLDRVINSTEYLIMVMAPMPNVPMNWGAMAIRGAPIAGDPIPEHEHTTIGSFPGWAEAMAGCEAWTPGDEPHWCPCGAPTGATVAGPGEPLPLPDASPVWEFT
jgi:hypothetical protein